MKGAYLVAISALLLGTALAQEPDGKSIYAQNCQACHQPNAKGIPGAFPPLEGTLGSYYGSPEGRAFLVHVVNSGLQGEIEVAGTKYNGTMTPLSNLNDADMAAVLNYVATEFNSEKLPDGFKPLAPEEVAQFRKANLSPAAVLEERSKLPAE